MSDRNDLRSCSSFSSIPRNKMKSQLVAVLSNSVIYSAKLVPRCSCCSLYFTFQKEYPRSFVSYLKPVSERTCTLMIYDKQWRTAISSFSNFDHLFNCTSFTWFKPHSDLTNSKTRRKKLTEITTGRQKIKYNNQSERRNRIIRIILLLREEDFISSEKNEAKKEGMLSGTTLHLAKY